MVDDVISIRTLIEKTLTNAGYGVITCDNGLEAISALNKNDVDLIITDMHMPEMDGLRLVSMLHHRKSEIPILVSTSDKSDTIKQSFKDKGVNGWLAKPIDPTRLLTAVSSFLA